MRLPAVALILLLSLAVAAAHAQTDEPASARTGPETGPELLHELRSFRELGGLLYVAAHPDDENTELIAWAARALNLRTAYLSVTRGDGGQNVLGPELGELLGVARTHELLAARRIDGGRQFFTRAIDFGFSKDADETLKVWDREKVLGDVVRVIRTFRPDVIVTRFSPQPGGTHGHHTASAVLALEAFHLAGDPNAYPEQLDTLQPWQPTRIFENGWRFGAPRAEDGVLRLTVGETDPISGEPTGVLAGRSRAMHKTQGFGDFAGGGPAPREEAFRLMAGCPASGGLFDGIDTTWARIEGGEPVAQLTDRLIETFDVDDPAASLPGLLELRALLADLPDDPVVAGKLHDLDRIIQGVLGLEVRTLAPRAEVVPGEAIDLELSMTQRAGRPVRWSAARLSAGDSVSVDEEPTPAGTTTRRVVLRVPADMEPTQPYWLRERPEVGIFTVADPSLIGRPENPPALYVDYELAIDDQTLVLRDVPVVPDPAGGESEPVIVVPPASLGFDGGVSLFAPGHPGEVIVTVQAARPVSGATLRLAVPEGWSVTPESFTVELESESATGHYAFTVTPPDVPATADLRAGIEVDGRRYSTSRVEFNYGHIPRQVLQPEARLCAVSLQLETRGTRVGYVLGAGDDIPIALRRMGYELRVLEGKDLTPEGLAGLDALVFGIRAFNVLDDLEARMDAVFEFVQQGGNVIVQYNNPRGLTVSRLAPFDLSLSELRITVEDSPLTVLAPDHPVMNRPNQIVTEDFDGWVQERGLYFPNRWGAEFTAVLAGADPGEQPLEGGLLVARYGEGYYVYTPLAWFRQLPAGVPGAYRLFANILALGRE